VVFLIVELLGGKIRFTVAGFPVGGTASICIFCCLVAFFLVLAVLSFGKLATYIIAARKYPDELIWVDTAGFRFSFCPDATLKWNDIAEVVVEWSSKKSPFECANKCCPRNGCINFIPASDVVREEWKQQLASKESWLRNCMLWLDVYPRLEEKGLVVDSYDLRDHISKLAEVCKQFKSIDYLEPEKSKTRFSFFVR